MNALEEKYFGYNEPVKSCFLAIRDIILDWDSNFKDCLKYGCICYTYRDKVALFAMHNKKGETYLLVNFGKQMNHPELKFDGRKSMKSLRIDPTKDLPIEVIEFILEEVRRIIDDKLTRKKK